MKGVVLAGGLGKRLEPEFQCGMRNAECGVLVIPHPAPRTPHSMR